MDYVLLFNVDKDVLKVCQTTFPKVKVVSMIDFMTRKADFDAKLAIIGCEKENYLDVKHLVNYFGNMDIIFISRLPKESVVKDYPQNWTYLKFPCDVSDIMDKHSKLIHKSSGGGFLSNLFSSGKRKERELSTAEKILAGEIDLKKGHLNSSSDEMLSEEQKKHINDYREQKLLNKKEDAAEEQFLSNSAKNKNDKVNRIIQLSKNKGMKISLDNNLLNAIFNAIDTNTSLYIIDDGSPCITFLPDERIVRVHIKEVLEDSTYRSLAQESFKNSDRFEYSSKPNFKTQKGINNFKIINFDNFLIEIVCRMFYDIKISETLQNTVKQLVESNYKELCGKKFILQYYPNISFFTKFNINSDVLLQLSTIWTKNVTSLEETLHFMSNYKNDTIKIFFILFLMRKLYFIEKSYMSLIQLEEWKFNILYEWKKNKLEERKEVKKEDGSRIKQVFGNIFSKFKF